MFASFQSTFAAYHFLAVPLSDSDHCPRETQAGNREVLSVHVTYGPKGGEPGKHAFQGGVYHSLKRIKHSTSCLFVIKLGESQEWFRLLSQRSKGWRAGRMLETLSIVYALSCLSYLHIKISTCALTSHRTKTREQFIKDWYYINLENQLFVSFCCCFISKHIENSYASQCFFLSFR